MEKFTNWRDAATGISPFMPIPNSNSGKGAVKYLLGPVRLLAFAVRGLFLVLLLALYILSVPVAPLQKLVLGLLLELVFGVIETEVQIDGIKRSNTKLTKVNRPNKRDLVIANLSSPLDPLALACISNSSISSCLFLIPDGAGDLRSYSVWGAFKFALSDPVTAHQGEIIHDVAKFKNKTLFVFPESTTSNNKAILPFNPKLGKLSDLMGENTFKLKAISTKSYPPQLTTTPLPTSVITFLWTSLSHLKFETRFKSKVFLLESESTWKEARTALTNYGKLNLVGNSLNLQAKIAFIAAFKKGKGIS
ncbi:unnamed protein product [Kuraishia capsulata CBS 1993]|uniref:Phospholipid/glycerol acyltransferase domain-containing protein n=1 Tax=Kuraishia capsulata CBS 1993 TaxID=1382522 RepID=W6MSF2_9ASCO|nr:uncharacterized protein KUCA_T00004118001 [Kuraishia capsulata CBS 1993]CDK28137.1 unnamed protein product [Kuraishia capsulata CBS 1993]